MQEKINHAKSYPFAIPDHSFVYANGGYERLDHGRFERDSRIPVLAAGSNQSPEQIRRKFAALDGEVIVPAERGRLHDFDVVYAAHLSSYGSLPATFQASPGTAVTVFVLWLDGRQLARMHKTEGNYTFDHLAGIAVELDGGGGLGEAFSYSSKVGCLNHGGGCLGLAEIPAARRRFPELGQHHALGIVRDRLAPDTPLDDFIGHHVEDISVRHARSRALAEDALPLEFERTTIDEL